MHLIVQNCHFNFKKLFKFKNENSFKFKNSSDSSTDICAGSNIRNAKNDIGLIY